MKVKKTVILNKKKGIIPFIKSFLKREYEKRRHSIVITYFIDTVSNKRHSIVFYIKKKCRVNKEAVLYL